MIDVLTNEQTEEIKQAYFFKSFYILTPDNEVLYVYHDRHLAFLSPEDKYCSAVRRVDLAKKYNFTYDSKYESDPYIRPSFEILNFLKTAYKDSTYVFFFSHEKNRKLAEYGLL